MKNIDFLKDYAERNGLEFVAAVEESHQEESIFFAIFDGKNGVETKRVDPVKEIVYENSTGQELTNKDVNKER